ncbi:MAG: uracil-DNA glycosylase family protein [Planctomycetota bacterium]|jgi:single-strand selective monofunctional uracil DNA glycosylase
MRLLEIDRKLATEVDALSFPEPVAQVYNPLVYARRPHEMFLERYGRQDVPTLLLGMNPGPWGMAQTGVPFGEVEHVREWLGIEAPVDKPEVEHPKRPIEGFDCTRSEVSGRRLWGWAREYFQTPEAFFQRFFVLNYCPLVFMEESGRNLTPDKLPATARDPLFEVCNRSLRETVEWLRPRKVIGVGKFAEKRAREVLGDFDLEFGFVLHPSPASPIANRGWAPQAEAQLEALGTLD